MIDVCQVLMPKLFSEKKRKRNSPASKPRSLLIPMCQLCPVIPERGDIPSTAFPTIKWRWTINGNPPTPTRQGPPFLTYWLRLFKFLNTLSEVLPLLKSHLLIRAIQCFRALILEHYMTLNHMLCRIPPWRTWDHVINTFSYFCMMTEKAWRWPPRWESSGAHPWSITPSYSCGE